MQIGADHAPAVSGATRSALTAVWLAASMGLFPAAGVAQTTRDSAGIRIVESRAPQWTRATAWRFSDSPTLQIGAVDGDASALLNRTGSATRLSDGRVVVAQPSELRVFDAAGRHLQTIGRRGQGPGEFALGISGVVALAGDTIAVGQSRSIVLFDPRGAYARSVPTAPPGMVRDHRAEGARILPDGSALINLYDPEPKQWPLSVMRPRHGFVRVAQGAGRVDTVGFFPGFEQVVTVGGSRPEIEIRPFARITHATSGGDRVYIGDNERYAIRTYALRDMRLLMEIRGAGAPIPVTPAMRAAWAERQRKSLEVLPPARRAVEGPVRERAIASADFPPTLPAFAALAADRLGNLWVRATPTPGQESAIPTFTVFDRSGRLLGDIRPPAGATILELGDSYMLGLWKNEDDVEFVRVYSLIKP